VVLLNARKSEAERMTTQAHPEQVDPSTNDTPKPKRHRRKVKPDPPEDALLPRFIFDPPGFVKFPTCMIQWGTVKVAAGHTQIKFLAPFYVLSGVTADWHQEDGPPILFTIYDSTLNGFKVFADAPRSVTYLAVGR
jgi:hypothetical protein